MFVMKDKNFGEVTYTLKKMARYIFLAIKSVDEIWYEKN